VPRPRAFDLEQATERAMRLFWKRGYAATSVRDLCLAMSLNPGSFYAAFQSKERCFRLALDRYLATQPVPRVPGPEAIRRWFEVIVDPRRAPKGCLLVMSAVELPLLDPASRRTVRAALARTRAFFARCLADRPEQAALLTAAVTAIHVMARAGTPPAELRRVADQALASACLS
jgi:TetR/AcrR family transcriptional repressor of nem operon